MQLSGAISISPGYGLLVMLELGEDHDEEVLPTGLACLAEVVVSDPELEKQTIFSECFPEVMQTAQRSV